MISFFFSKDDIKIKTQKYVWEHHIPKNLKHRCRCYAQTQMKQTKSVRPEIETQKVQTEDVEITSVGGQ